MKKNVGIMDTKVRYGLGAVAAVLAVIAFVGGATIAGIVAAVVAVIMVGTAQLGFCPLYLPFGMDTREDKA